MSLAKTDSKKAQWFETAEFFTLLSLVERPELTETLKIGEKLFNSEAARAVFRWIQSKWNMRKDGDLTPIDRADLDRSFMTSPALRAHWHYVKALLSQPREKLHFDDKGKISEQSLRTVIHGMLEVKGSAMVVDRLAQIVQSSDSLSLQGITEKLQGIISVKGELLGVDSTQDMDAMRFENMITSYWTEFEAHQQAAREPMSTGISSLDKAMRLIQINDFVILAARTGQFKTTLALNIMRNVVSHGKRVMYVCTEMSHFEIMSKFISAHAIIPQDLFRFCQFRGEHCSAIGALFQKYMERHASGQHIAPFMIMAGRDAKKYTVDDIIAKASEYEDVYGHVDLLIVDHAQRLEPAPSTLRLDRRLQVKYNAEQLRNYSLDNGTPTILLSQITRIKKVIYKGKVTVPRPTDQDLKEAGDLEENATHTLLLHYPYRYEYDNVDYMKNDPVALERKSYLELYMDKNRFGDSAFIPLNVNSIYGTITSRQSAAAVLPSTAGGAELTNDSFDGPEEELEL